MTAASDGGRAQQAREQLRNGAMNSAGPSRGTTAGSALAEGEFTYYDVHPFRFPSATGITPKLRTAQSSGGAAATPRDRQPLGMFSKNTCSLLWSYTHTLPLDMIYILRFHMDCICLYTVRINIAGIKSNWTQTLYSVCLKINLVSW